MHTVNIKTINGRQRGFSLIEVLIAVLVLGIGLLGMAQMQASGMRSTHHAYIRTQATMLASEMLESMRANLTAARSGNYDILFTATPSGTSRAALDLIEWKNNLNTSLPNGDGEITTSGSDVTVAVSWTSIHQNENSGNAQPKTFSVDSTL